MRTILAGMLALAAASAAASAEAQTLLDTAHTLGKPPAAVTLPFTVPAAGTYRLTLTDFGSASGPARLARADAGVLRGSELVSAQSVTSATTGGTAVKTFTATAGEHRLVLIGQPNAPASRVGSAGVRIEDAGGGAVLLDTLQSFSVPPPAAASPATFEHELVVGAGVYTLETTDFALPQTLAMLQTTVIRNGAVLADFSGSGQTVLVASGDETFEVFVYAELVPGAARGLVGLNLRDAGGATRAAAVDELGEWPFEYDVDVPGNGNMTASLVDLGFPLPLAGVAATVVRDGRRVAQLAPAVPAVFPATPGGYRVYVAAAPAASSAGSFGLLLTQGGAALLDTVENVTTPGPATDVEAIDTSFDMTTAGNYTLTLTDFGQSGFFDALTSVALALTRDGQIVGTLNAAGSFSFAATPGRYHVAILADPWGTDGEGLIGVRVAGGPGDATAFDVAYAVGADFFSAEVDVAGTTNVDVHIADLGFPAGFTALKTAVTRGAERVGEIVGNGTFSFAATPGRYRVNLLAQPNAGVGYGTFGVLARVTPPAPAVTLAASATSVTVGSGVTLTWSAANATSCVASGTWSGARATSGSETIAALNANATFTLTCAGDGGSEVKTVAVAVVAAQRASGGGGGSDPWWLAALAALAAWRRGRAARGRVTGAPSR